MMNVLSLFDWISCGQVALKRLGLPVKKYYASEIKEYAVSVTQENHPSTIQLWDVRGIKCEGLDIIDLLIWGSPCQDFSGANKERKWLRWEKSGLFYEYVRLLRECKPKYFLLENVRMKRDQQDIISKELWIEPIVINSKLVCWQLRHRLYRTNIKVDSMPVDQWVLLQSILETWYTDREKARCILAWESRPLSTPVKMFHRYYSACFTTLIFKSESHYRECKVHYDNNYKWMKAKDIICNSDVYNWVRYFNARELERLQTMPEWYVGSLSRNKAACVLWDWWTVDVICHILSFIK